MQLGSLSTASTTAPRVLPVISNELDRPLDNTAMSAYNRCPRLYDYSMRQHMRSKGSPSPALAFGKLWHTMLEWHYKSNGDSQVVIDKALKAGIDHDHPDDYRTVERAVLEYGKYVKHFGMPSEEQYTTFGYPDSPLIEIATSVANDALLYPYTVKIDRFIERDGEIYVEDYKTTSRWESNFFKKFKLDNQMRGYAFAGGLIAGRPIAGVRVNVLVCRKNDSQFEREVITYTPEQLDEWLENYNTTVSSIQRAYLDGFRANFTDGACSGKYGLCQYFGACTIRKGLRQQVLERDFEYNPWNPLESEDEYVDI